MSASNWRGSGLASSLLCFAPFFLQASPVTSTWIGGTGDWSNPANWATPSGPPQAGYQLLIDNTTPPSVLYVDVPTPLLNNVGVASQASVILQADLATDEVTSFGGVIVGNPAVMNVGGGGFVQDGVSAATTVNAGASILDRGTYSQGGGSTVIDGTLSTSLLHITGGTLTTGTGGLLSIGQGGYVQDRAVTNLIDSGGQVIVSGDYSQGNGSTVVNGSLSTSLVSVTGGSISIGAGGQLTVGGGGYAQGVAGTTTTIDRGGELSVIGGDYSQEIGTSTVLDGVLNAPIVNNSGVISGSGVINGYLRDLGTLGGPDENGNPATLDIVGMYAQFGILDIDIDGADSWSQLNVSGHAVLGGTLDISLGDGFTPEVGESFTVMNYGNESGTFDNIVDSDLPAGEFWNVSYDPAGLLVTLEGAPENQSGFERLEIDPAPEPTTLLTGGGALCALLLLFRLRKQTAAKKEPAPGAGS